VGRLRGVGVMLGMGVGDAVGRITGVGVRVPAGRTGVGVLAGCPACTVSAMAVPKNSSGMGVGNVSWLGSAHAASETKRQPMNTKARKGLVGREEKSVIDG
jgi:type IV secretory pathway TrbL component